MLSPRDQLRPFLLDRLTDDAATRRPARPAGGGPPPADAGHLSPGQYRESVLRDLSVLLNAHAAAADEDLEQRWPEVAASVVNFGLPDLSTFAVRVAPAGTLERTIARAIERFEPRLVAGSVSVRILDGRSEPYATGAGPPGTLAVEVTAHLWALPAPEALTFRTHVDCGAGQCLVGPKR